MNYRLAGTGDLAVLAELNAQLIEDTRHRSSLTVEELKPLIVAWLGQGYRAVLFELNRGIVAYALYRVEDSYRPGEPTVYLKQFFVGREYRRRGIGRRAFALLEEEIWPPGCRITADVLVHNTTARRFWKSIGFHDYAVILEKCTAAG